MSRIASLLVGAFLAFGLAGCDVDMDEDDPDVIDTEPGDVIINEDRDPDINVHTDDPLGDRDPDVDVDIDTDDPDTQVNPEIDLNPPGTAGEGTVPPPELENQ